ncbi:hypothetical protein LCGC14_0246090 [marine sediment metagenome]|uniref:SF4 helicase domain-containing protein n=1 Tax=marine sediment metagenome TaxID=412755 RepID=A0A0F9XAM8_9ZZZZ
MESKLLTRTLPIVTAKQAAELALKEIEEGRSGIQRSLLTRWKHVNNLLVGGFRFGNTYVLGGMSGGGKSYKLNMLREDFLNKELNSMFTKPFRLIHFAMEMSASDEVLRTVGGNIKTSYQSLISAFRKLPDQKFTEAMAYLESMKHLDMDFVEVTGNVLQLKQTILEYQAKYPGINLIVSLDHTLLTDYLNEKDEIQLVTNVSKMFLSARKEIGCMGIIVAQLNDKIEDISRIGKANFHYPTKKDIHGAKAIYRDADCVMVLHDPSQLGIRRYGPESNPDGQGGLGYTTEDRVFLHVLKMRKGVPGMIVFTQDFKNGNLHEEIINAPRLVIE